MSTMTIELDEKTYGQLLGRTLPHVIHTDEECERFTNELLRLDEREDPSPEEKELAELLTMLACDLKIRGEKMSKESAMAKYFASEVAVKTSTEAVQIFGGYGYTKDFPVEKFYRDSKLCTIGEGTSEIQKIVIAREVLK